MILFKVNIQFEGLNYNYFLILSSENREVDNISCQAAIFCKFTCKSLILLQIITIDYAKKSSKPLACQHQPECAGAISIRHLSH